MRNLTYFIIDMSLWNTYLLNELSFYTMFRKKSSTIKSFSIFHKPPVDLVYQKSDLANTFKFKFGLHMSVLFVYTNGA